MDTEDSRSCFKYTASLATSTWKQAERKRLKGTMITLAACPTLKEEEPLFNAGQRGHAGPEGSRLDRHAGGRWLLVQWIVWG